MTAAACGFNEAAVLHGGGPNTSLLWRSVRDASTRPPFFTAEVLTLVRLTKWTWPLQRGRRSSRRRSSSATRAPWSQKLLQRGRRSSRRRSPKTTTQRTSPSCFNEAAVLHGGGRRPPPAPSARTWSFNEAAVLHGGGRLGSAWRRASQRASTRPPFFTAEVPTAQIVVNGAGLLQRGRRSSRRRSSFALETRAPINGLLQRGRRSSRRRSAIGGGPFTGGLLLQRGRRSSRRRSAAALCDFAEAFVASTRPPFFTAEVVRLDTHEPGRELASTRPPFFTAEVGPFGDWRTTCQNCFNEAAVLHGGGRGQLRRKVLVREASTRPPFFTAEVPTCTKRRTASPCSLQRGRRSSRRRSWRWRRSWVSRVRLQRGRRSSRRRSRRSWRSTPASFRLQRGRRSSRRRSAHHGLCASDIISLQRGRRSSRRRSWAMTCDSTEQCMLQRGRRSSRRRSRWSAMAAFVAALLQRGRRSSRRRSMLSTVRRALSHTLQRGRRSSRRRSQPCG